MDFEATITNIGKFGFYQKSLLFFTGFLFMGSGIQTLVNVFILYVPSFSCASNNTYENTTDECYIYQDRGNGFNTTDSPQESVACKSWVYDKSNFTASAATDMNFVCGKADMVPLINMIYMGGVLTASFVFGFLSDWKGRKPAECIALVIQILCTFPLYFIKSAVLLTLLRFFGGISGNAVFIAAFVLVMENVPSTYRTFVGIYSQMMFSIGEIVVVGIAYFTREWHLLCLVLAFICLFLSFSMFFIDESSRWIISKGKMDKAEAILRKIAKKNKMEFDIMILDSNCKEETTAAKGNFNDLFKSRILFYRALNVIFNWAAVNTVYYGLMFGSSNLTDDLFVSTLLMAVVELAAYIVLLFLLKHFGRRTLYSSSIILAGVSCFASGFIKVWAKDINWLSIVLLLIGKFAASSSFAMIFNYTIELFPTSIRNSILGVSSCFARLGSMAAPYILIAGVQMKSEFGVGLPVVLFGIFAIVAGLLSLFLPETKDYNLPDTFEEGENIGRKVMHEIKGEDNIGMVSD